MSPLSPFHSNHQIVTEQVPLSAGQKTALLCLGMLGVGVTVVLITIGLVFLIKEYHNK